MTPNTTHETTAAELLELARQLDNDTQIIRGRSIADRTVVAIRELAALKAQQPSGAQAGLVGRMAEALRVILDVIGKHVDAAKTSHPLRGFVQIARALLAEYDASPLPGEQPVAARVTITDAMVKVACNAWDRSGRSKQRLRERRPICQPHDYARRPRSHRPHAGAAIRT